MLIGRPDLAERRVCVGWRAAYQTTGFSTLKKIIHVTDFHLRQGGQTLFGIDPAERLATVVRSINDNHPDASFCAITGDIADDGDSISYELARTCLEKLRVPYRITAGNHDLRTNLRTAFPDMPTDGDGFFQSTVELGDLACVFLDTLDERHVSQGFMCVSRLAWFEAELDRLRGRDVMIFMHHPPLSVQLDYFDSMLLSNGRQLMEIIEPRDRIRHIAFGHLHVNTSGVWRGIGFSSSRGTCHKILADPTARHVKYVDHGAAYNILFVGVDSICVHPIDPAGLNTLIGRESLALEERGLVEELHGSEVTWM